MACTLSGDNYFMLENDNIHTYTRDLILLISKLLTVNMTITWAALSIY